MNRRGFVVSALLVSLSTGASATAQTADRWPAFEVVIDNRSSAAGSEVAVARSRASFMFAEAGIHVAFVMKREGVALAAAGHDLIHVVVLDQDQAERLIPADVTSLGFALPAAGRAYVHYDRVYALARSHGVQPGWFLGMVMVHELVHVLLPRAGHANTGVMARALSPDPRGPVAFTREESQALRERLRGETILAQR